MQIYYDFDITKTSDETEQFQLPLSERATFRLQTTSFPYKIDFSILNVHCGRVM